LLREARRLKLSGVALKDDSEGRGYRVQRAGTTGLSLCGNRSLL
jgi:hypothetical protein